MLVQPETHQTSTKEMTMNARDWIVKHFAHLDPLRDFDSQGNLIAPDFLRCKEKGGDASCPTDAGLKTGANPANQSKPGSNAAPHVQPVGSGERARTIAKAILADGKWSHNHYSPQEMEDLITRVVRASGKQSGESNLDGDWLDEMGACKLCGGEIPHGHADNCYIWKLEQRLQSGDRWTEARQKKQNERRQHHSGN